jgi:transposase-like protein
MKRARSLGPTIQSKPDFCPTCDGRRIIKRGLRKNSFRHLQIYWCKDCRGYFVSLVGLKGVKYPPRVIARTLCLYNLGHSQEAAARRIASEHRITVPRRTISHWISGYRSVTTFHRFRAAALFFSPPPATNRCFRTSPSDRCMQRNRRIYMYERAAQTPHNPAKPMGSTASESPGIFWRNPWFSSEQERPMFLGIRGVVLSR